MDNQQSITPGVGRRDEPESRTDAGAFLLEVADFTVRLTDYMKTRITPWKDEREMVEAVALALALVFQDAVDETYPLAKRAKELFGHD